MKNNIWVSLLVLIIILVGCTRKPSYSPPSCKVQASQLEIGMTKPEALKIMAREPERYAAIKNVQYVHFNCDGPDYIIRFVDGKIEAYGREGDFDLTKEPRALINIKTESNEKKEVIIKHEGTKSKK